MERIINLVSKGNGAGKSAAAAWFAKDQKNKWIPFTSDLKLAANVFWDAKYGKDEKHPDLGVTKRQFEKAFGRALDDLNEELSTYFVKKCIEKYLEWGHNIIIDDCRRQREFQWLEALAERTGAFYIVVEIVPTFPTSPDVWDECKEPWGAACWPDNRLVIENDGTDQFFKELADRIAQVRRS